MKPHTNAVWGGMEWSASVRELAEREGFEPPEPYGSTVFKTAAFDHSATSPVWAFSDSVSPHASRALAVRMLAMRMVRLDHYRRGCGMSLKSKKLLPVLCLWLGQVLAQDGLVADPAQLAFEEGRWVDAISEYRSILDDYPEDRLSWLRIAQAERELERYEAALATLERAISNDAPEAMVHVERARNFLGLGRPDEALVELETADHVELRARQLLEEAEDFDPLRENPRFQRIYRNVRSRVHPCEEMPEAAEFDFWLGRWEVRGADGRLLGHNTVTREDGGCSVHESWEGNAGSTGSSVTFYLPSRGQWRQVWVGSGGTHFDMTGGLNDGEMHLEGTIEYLDQEQVIAFRSTWSVGAGGRVRQRMEQFDLVSQNWELWFDGFYRRLD